jgi:hypothetical protein
MHYLTYALCGSLLFIISCSSVTGADSAPFQDLDPDVSALTDDQKELINYNASYLAFREQYEKDTTFIDIPKPLFESYYNALATVITSEAASEHEIIKEVRIFDSWDLFRIVAEPKAGAPFLESWTDSSITTNIKEIDAFLADRGFQIKSTIDFSWNENLYFRLISESAFNTLRIAELLSQTEHFETVQIGFRGGDGGDIEVKVVDDVYQFTFINSYMGCRAGCIYNDKYIFHLTKSGQVKFIGTN